MIRPSSQRSRTINYFNIRGCELKAGMRAVLALRGARLSVGASLIQGKNWCVMVLVLLAVPGCGDGSSGVTRNDGDAYFQVEPRDGAATENSESSSKDVMSGIYRKMIDEIMDAAPGESRFNIFIDHDPEGACGVSQDAHYCRADRGIYINRKFIDRIYSTYGAPAARYVIAHEYGHAINDVFGTSKHSIVRELFSDCIAGYISGRYGEGVTWDEFAKVVEFTHQLGSDSFAKGGSHGYGQQRFSAFLWGFTFGGAEKAGKVYVDASCYYFTDGDN